LNNLWFEHPVAGRAVRPYDGSPQETGHLSPAVLRIQTPVPNTRIGRPQGPDADLQYPSPNDTAWLVKQILELSLKHLMCDCERLSDILKLKGDSVSSPVSHSLPSVKFKIIFKGLRVISNGFPAFIN